MYSGYHSSRSKRQDPEPEKPQSEYRWRTRVTPEPEKPQSEYRWRTRVNTLMNTSDEPRASKITTTITSNRSSRSDLPARDSRPTVQIGSFNRISASRWLRDDKEGNSSTHRSLPEDVRRERFSRTKSDDHLKTRGVRFVSATSKSLDGDDEDESMSFGGLRMREKQRRCHSSSDEDGDNKSPRRSWYDETDSTDNEGSEYGACGGSFDSGLDLRISCSPDGDYSEHHDNNPTRSPSYSSTSGSKESSRSNKSHEDSLTQTSKFSSSTPSRPIPGVTTSDPNRADDAIPKRLGGARSYLHAAMTGATTEPLSNETWNKDQKGKYTTSSRHNQVDDYDYSSSYPPRERIPEHQYKRQRDRDHLESVADGYHDSTQRIENDAKENGKKTVDEIPGFSFFSGNTDYMEDIIQRVIDAEENEIKDDTEEIERLSDTLVFPEDQEATTNRTAETDDVHIQHHILDESDPGVKNEGGPRRRRRYSPFAYRKRASSLPPRIEDNEDDLTELLFRSWKMKLKCKQMEEKQNSREEGKEDEWACVPSVFLEDVFTFLSPKERHQASQVCRHWYDLFYSPRVWETFILLERTLTKKRFNLYKGYQRELCPWKAQICLRRVGSFFKRIVITPITDYFNLCEFLRVLAAFLEYQVNQGETPMPLLHTFDFTFACATRSSEGLLVHGTGGQILDMIVKLLTQMTNLKHLKVNQLLTDTNEVPVIFAALTQCFCECLSSLEMLNISKIPYPIPEFAQFRNLIKLTVSPQHIDDEVVVLLAGLNLLHLHLHQDVYTCECAPVRSEAWKLVKEMAPWLQVYLEISGITRTALLIQPRAPVYGVFFRTPYSRLSNELVSDIVEHYSKTVRYVVQEHLPRIHGPRGFDKRCDSSLLFLIRRCQKLHTLVISERISTSTLLLLATEGKNLKTLLVRQNGIIKRCDWPACGELSKDFHARLKENALDYDKCREEMCNILRRRWRPLTDKQFMRLNIVPRVDVMY